MKSIVSPQYTVIKIAANALRIHPVAQRNLLPAKLKKLTDALDLDAIGVLHGVRYAINGVTHVWIIDGQHRVRALLERAMGDWEVEVKIHLDVTDDARACALFLKLNDRSPVSPYDKFVNEVRAGLPVAAGVTFVLESRGIKIGRTGANGQACCVMGLKRVYEMDGGKSLGFALDAILSAWGIGSAGLEGKIVEGLGAVYAAHGNSIDHGSLCKKLAKYSGGAAGLLGAASALRAIRKSVSLSACVAETVVEVYNSGRRAGALAA